jgi:hypothetical protein
MTNRSLSISLSLVLSLSQMPPLTFYREEETEARFSLSLSSQISNRVSGGTFVMTNLSLSVSLSISFSLSLSFFPNFQSCFCCHISNDESLSLSLSLFLSLSPLYNHIRCFRTTCIFLKSSAAGVSFRPPLYNTRFYLFFASNFIQSLFPGRRSLIVFVLGPIRPLAQEMYGLRLYSVFFDAATGETTI